MMEEDEEVGKSLEETKSNVVEFKQPDIKPNKEKLSYEQLEQVAIQATQQAKKFYAELQQANYGNLLNRMQMLFEVIHYSEKFDNEFVCQCAEEIKKFLTLEQPDVEQPK